MNLLFVCTHNACRSILAEAITRSIAGDRIQVASAGSSPAGRVHPLTIEFLQSGDYPTAGLISKGFDELGEFSPDVVVTVCDSAANESCPVWLSGNAIVVHWGLPDPSQLPGTSDQRMTMFRSIADTLKNRIEGLLSLPFESMDRTELERTLITLGKN